MITEREQAAVPSPGEQPEPSLAWCLGLPASGMRPLAAEELAEVAALRRQTLRSLWQVPALGLGAVVLLVTWALAAARIPALAEGFPATLVGAVEMLALAYTVLRLRDLLRRAGALAQDAERGEVEVFEAPASEDPAAAGKAPTHQRVEVLPHSRLVLRLDGQRPDRHDRVEIARAAAAPRNAVRWAFPRSWAGDSESLEGLTRRRLSEGERAELVRSIRSLRRPSGCLLGVAGFFLLMVSAMAVNHFRGGPVETGFSDVLVGVLWTFALGRGTYQYVKARRLAERLDFDLDAGWVAVVEREDEAAAEEPGNSGDLEVLPTAGLPWTQSGRPAPWRFEMGAG